MADADGIDCDGRRAVFAIVTSATPNTLQLLGSGFFVQTKGGFATAAHVARDAQEILASNPGSVGISYTLPDGRTFFCPIWKFYFHPTADVAFGIPGAEFVNERTNDVYRSMVLCLTEAQPGIGAAISTWAYPLHRVLGDEQTGQALQLQPDFYNGALQEFYEERGPSAKIKPPYYLTNIYLHGASSGGPVFNNKGEVFGIASCSYEGAEDVAFVTPASKLLDIMVPERVGDDEDKATMVSLRAIAARGFITMR
ncbi:MAG TPA: serine protease [Xanthobacteraceae bacterium]|jgi:hypothetical protein|nr:serine protease [Xanthobacteraceae bacterium]